MEVQTAQTIFEQFGVIGLVVVGFFVLVWWVLKTSTEREDKLYKIIDKLSDELPEIRSTLAEINKKVDRIETQHSQRK